VLLDKGANTEATRNIGTTALHASAHEGHLEIVKLLLEKGAVLGARNNKNETVVDLAVKNGHKAVVELLTASLQSLK